MKYFIMLLVLTLNLFSAGRPLLLATPYEDVKSHIGAGTPTFLEIVAYFCKSCRKMGKMFYVIIESSANAPLYFIDVHKNRAVASKLKIMMIPTQIIYDAKGNEVFRHVGGLEQKELNATLHKYNILANKKPQTSTIAWQHDYDDALEYAQKVHKPLLLFMSQEHCGSCKYMKEEVFTDAPLIAYINAHFIPVMLDMSDMMVPDELQVEVTPVFHFLDENGTKLRESLIGGKTAPFFLPLLEKIINK